MTAIAEMQQGHTEPVPTTGAGALTLVSPVVVLLVISILLLIGGG